MEASTIVEAVYVVAARSGGGGGGDSDNENQPISKMQSINLRSYRDKVSSVLCVIENGNTLICAHTD